MTKIQGPPDARKSRRNLSRRLETLLSEQILEGRLRGGERLPTETAIMLEHHVSRTVVREAISRLQARAMVETRHGIGTFVRGSALSIGPYIDPATIETLFDSLSIMELRIALEVETAGLAAQRRTSEQLSRLRALLDQSAPCEVPAQEAAAFDFQFHLQIAEATGNHYLVHTLNQLGVVSIPRSRLDSAQFAQDDPQHYEERMRGEHEQIYETILRQDVESARAAMRLHLTGSREWLLYACRAS